MTAKAETARPYILTYEEGWICAQGPKEITDQLRRIFGAGLSPAGFIYFPASRAAYLAAEALASPAWVTIEYQRARSAAMATPPGEQAAAALALQDLGLRRPLLPYQLDFCARARPRRAALNASEQGTGKTATAWAMAALWGSGRVLILCPKSLCRQWGRELQVLWDRPPWAFTALDSGSTTDRARELTALGRATTPQAVALNYEALEAVEAAIEAYGPDLVCCDESWRLKNPKAQVTRAAIRLCDCAAHVLLLTGTPVGQHVGDLWSQLRCLGPEAAPEDHWTFVTRFAHVLPIQYGGGRPALVPRGCRDPLGLMARLEPLWFRATKATCLQLPPQHDTVVSLTLPEETASLYAAVEEHGESALGDELSLQGKRTVMLRLQQLTGGFRPVPGRLPGTWDLVPIGCPKVAWLKQFARDRLEGDLTSRAIVWCHFRHEVERVVDELTPRLGKGHVVGVNGDTENTCLERWKESFNSRDPRGIRVIVTTMDKLFAGHNLQACDWNIYFSLTWSHIVHSQSRDRSHRQGREGAVEYLYLIAAGTIDAEIKAALDAHQDLTVRVAPDTCPNRLKG